MKPQKKAVVARKATKIPTVTKKRRALLERTMPDVRKEKKSKKSEKPDDSKKKQEGDKKKVEKFDEKKRVEEKKKIEDKKKEKPEKVDERKKHLKEVDKKLEKSDEKKLDKVDEKGVPEDSSQDNSDKKKLQKVEDKNKIEKQVIDPKKKADKAEEKKKTVKQDEEAIDDSSKESTVVDDKATVEQRSEYYGLTPKKRYKEEKKKEAKQLKLESKEITKVCPMKDKKLDKKKPMEKDATINKVPLVKTKKDSKVRPAAQKKSVSRKTVLAKKSSLSIVKRLDDKKIKLVKSGKDDDALVSEEDDATRKTKKKAVSTCKSKISPEKRPKFGKHVKSKLPQKPNKMNLLPKKEEKCKSPSDKIVPKKKPEVRAEVDKMNSDQKKLISKEEILSETEESNVKSEIEDNDDSEKLCKDEILQSKAPDVKKHVKNLKVNKKLAKKTAKTVKVQIESTNQIFNVPKEFAAGDPIKQSKIDEDGMKDSVSLAQEDANAESTLRINLKVEAINGENASDNASPSESEDESDEDVKKCKQREVKKKERANSPSDERARRMRLFGFWSGPKRHRVASLNALAKVHCLYENETGGVYLGGFCKPKPEKEKQKKTKEEKEDQPKKEKDKEKDKDGDKGKEKERRVDNKDDENAPKRKLRNVPGLRGKHWDMLESSSSSSSSDEECERVNEKSTEHARKKIIKRRRKNEEVMDLKDMVVCKRMASLNATAILAASYSDEKNRHGSSSDSSSESEVEIIKRRKQSDSDAEKRKSRQGSDPDEVLKPSNKLVIVNQDTDVTITGVYVNQTRSTHHEGFCSIAGMQYRISSTSHTQTAATAVATELHDQQKPEQPCKSYTPLGALSSMQPPGSQANHPNMSPRRHSAFSAPHQHGYYQPAGPLIQHPPTLPPVKGPPPEPTPTPPQNSEGSDDLVATSTTSGGTSSTGIVTKRDRAMTDCGRFLVGGGFYRAYCPQYYGTPPAYPDLCYPPTYSHPHAHPPPYYKYAPPYRRQYYGYQESGGGGGPGGGGTTGAPGVVDYQPPPPPPGEYPLPAFYGGYHPPPPPPPPPPPNPAYLHSQGRPFVDHAAFQGCPCPMQSCPKNVDTGPLIGNGKGAPVVSGPGLSLPPSALVGPPSPARGLAGLAPPHGANAWDTDRVQLNTHRNLNQNQPSVPPSSHNLVGGHNRPQNSDRRNKDEKNCSEENLRKCSCQKHACSTSACEIKMESLSPSEKLSAANCPSSKFHNFKIENNNVKCESCSVDMSGSLSCVGNCNVKCESDFKYDLMKCEQCLKEDQMAILEIDKDSGILMDDKLETEPDVKEEVNDVVVIDSEIWKKPDYEPTVQESVEEQTEKPDREAERQATREEQPKCQKLTKRKLSLDSLSDCRKKRKVSKRTLSVGSSHDLSRDSDDSVLDTSSSITNLPLPKKPENNTDEASWNKNQTSKKDSSYSQTQESNEVQNEGQDENQSQGENQDQTHSQGQAHSQSQNQNQSPTQVQNQSQSNGQVQSQNHKRKAEQPTSIETTPKKAKSSLKQNLNNGVSNCLKRAASDNSIMETINNVIQQSLQMTRTKDRKPKNSEKPEKRKKAANLMSTVKKVVRKVDFVKELASEKLAKLVTKHHQLKQKVDTKVKIKYQDVKPKNKAKSKSVESKSHGTKQKNYETKVKDIVKTPKHENVKSRAPSDASDVTSKKSALIKKKRKTVKKAPAKKSDNKLEELPQGIENLSLTRKTFLKPKWSNGWSWEGDPFEAKVYLTNEESAIRRCYASMRHESGDVLRPRDCVLLKSGPRKADLPFVAKIAALWENPDDGEMMFSLLWYYRPEHTEQGRTQYDTEDEVFASRHRDANSVACIEDKCYILTFNEYCRYRKNLRRIEEGLESPGLIVPPGDQLYPRENRQPPIPVPPDMVLFCRRVYDYRGKKLVKNPG